MRNNRGFTTVELLFSLVILVILAGIAVSQVKQLNSFKTIKDSAGAMQSAKTGLHLMTKEIRECRELLAPAEGIAQNSLKIVLFDKKDKLSMGPGDTVVYRFDEEINAIVREVVDSSDTVLYRQPVLSDLIAPAETESIFTNTNRTINIRINFKEPFEEAYVVDEEGNKSTQRVPRRTFVRDVYVRNLP